MNKNKYLLLISSIGVLFLLAVAATQDVFMDWCMIQRTALSEEGPIKVRIRQVINQGLQTSDRCVSCHVGMDPSEQGIRGNGVLASHKSVVHEPADLGCTICHGGQGAATEMLDAHGEVRFWPEPMIPKEFSQAGCGTCHVMMGIPNRKTYSRAKGAFEQLDCFACHRVDSRGGVMRPDGTGMEGPDLSRVAISGYDKNWYEKHLQKSGGVSSGPWKTSFAPIDEQGLASISIYLSTRVSAPKLVEAKSLFLSSGCLGCHKVSGTGGDEGPELTRAGEKDPGQVSFAHVQGKRSLANWLANHFQSPAALVAGSLMPPLAVDDRDLELLTMYALSLRRRDLPGSYLPKDRLRVEKLGEREFAPDGQTIFEAFCSGCHGSRGQGKRAPGRQTFPAIASPDFLSLVSDSFILETVTQGRPGRKMPAWGKKDGGLRPAEIGSAAAYLRTLGTGEIQSDLKPARWISGDTAAGERLFASACAACHGKEGKGGEGPALNNEVLLANATDTYLVETISKGRRGTNMEGFLIPSPARVALAHSEIETIVAYIRSWEGGSR
jgi:cytochrome c oxidase cbb3-type subunit 3